MSDEREKILEEASKARAYVGAAMGPFKGADQGRLQRIQPGQVATASGSPPTAVALGQLSQVIASINETVTEVEEKLRPILGPAPPSPENVEGLHPPVNGTSELVQRLTQTTQEATVALVRLRMLFDRFEV